MATVPSQRWSIHPLHAVVLAGTVPLFLAALLSDIAYWSSHQVQWKNFSSWLIAGGLVLAGIALVCALFELVRADRRAGRPLFYFLVLLATWVLGFLGALVHARDAWASMPGGLVFSVIVAVLACVATWIGFRGLRNGGTP